MSPRAIVAGMLVSGLATWVITSSPTHAQPDPEAMSRHDAGAVVSASQRATTSPLGASTTTSPYAGEDCQADPESCP